MFYEAVTLAQKVLDCGILYRTTDAAAEPLDKDTSAWLAASASAHPLLNVTH